MKALEPALQLKNAPTFQLFVIQPPFPVAETSIILYEVFTEIPSYEVLQRND